ncbi:MAG TPA: magnesium transporter CorA family protein [Chthoniobacterales bacterium]|nr:magnesium transporter CorA family protein [Chthoniobacterales bacterium]
MLTFYAPGQPGQQMADEETCSSLTRDAVWVDVLSPTRAEEKALEQSIGLNIPTREEMEAIELSSRLYKEKDVLFITMTIVANAHTERPESTAVTFMLTPERLVTLRYAEPLPFQSFRSRRDANPMNYKTGHDVFTGLVDAIIERIADILESVGASLDRISLKIFDAEGESGSADWADRASQHVSRRKRKAMQRDFVHILRRIGCNSDLVSRARESLVSLARGLAFYREMQKDNAVARESIVHLTTVGGDLASLSDHATFLAGKISFSLDATMGMINNEQNKIIKIMSVAAAVFLPPTLVASIYGMNFEVMPELKWAAGYPFAIVLMLISAVLPYAFFKRKGWL